MKPIIGIPCHTEKSPQGAYPPRFSMGQSYVRVIEEGGGIPLLIPSMEEDNLYQVFRRIDGLFLAGGSDVDPIHYQETPHAKLGEIDVLRDHIELCLTQWALRDKLPVLAVCRGIQVVNVAAGGSLYQDILAQVPDANEHQLYQKHPRNYLAHTVRLAEDSKLADFLCTTEIPVNSLHHQAIRRVAAGFRVVATSPDGIIEGIESENGNFALGVQWHPEALVHDDYRWRAPFIQFVKAAS